MELWRRWSGQQSDDGNGPLDDTSVTDPTMKSDRVGKAARKDVPQFSARHADRDGISEIVLRSPSHPSSGAPSLSLLEKIQKKIERYALEERNISREEQRIAQRIRELQEREHLLEERLLERKRSFEKTIDQSRIIASRLRDREEDLSDSLLSISLQLRERKLSVGPIAGDLAELRAVKQPQKNLLVAKGKLAAMLRLETSSLRERRRELLAKTIGHAIEMRDHLRTDIASDRERQKALLQSTLAHAKSAQLKLRRGIATDKKHQKVALESVITSAQRVRDVLVLDRSEAVAQKDRSTVRLHEIAQEVRTISMDLDERHFTIGHLIQLREERLREIADARLVLLAQQQRLQIKYDLRRKSATLIQEERRLQGGVNKIVFAEQAKHRKFTRLRADHLRLIDQRRKGLIRIRDLMMLCEPTNELSDLFLLIKSLEEKASSTERELSRLEKIARKTMVRWKDLRRELLEELILQDTFSPASTSAIVPNDSSTVPLVAEPQQEVAILPQSHPREKKNRIFFWRTQKTSTSHVNQDPAPPKEIAIPEEGPEEIEFSEPVTLPLRMRHLAQDWIPRQAFVFAAVTATCVLAIIGLSWAGKGTYLQARVMSQAHSALASLLAGKDALGNKSYDEAVASFTRADRGFSASQKLLTQFSPLAYQLASLLPQGKQIESGKALLAVGKSMATAGTALSHIAERFDGSPVIAADSEGHVQVTLSLFHESLKDIAIATHAISEASTEITKVNPGVIPEELRSQVQELKDVLPVISSSLHTFSSHMDSLMQALGEDHQKRYLVFFQNPTELRATGGFPGTYALIDVDRGSVTHMDVNGIYDPANQFPDRLRTVRPDQSMSEILTLQDANWWPDAPTSAKKMQEMWERAGGPSVDGVVFANATIAIDLLRVTGPLELPSYNATLSAENFYDVLQYEVEVQYDRSLNRPKQILTDAVPLLLQRLNTLSPIQQKEVMGLAVKWLAEKDVQIVLNDDTLQSVVQTYGWAGEIQTEFEGDRLTVTSTNFSGNKSDRDMSDRLVVVPIINGDGTVETEVTLTRTHNGKGLWPSGVNTSYIRLTVPDQAELISVSGFSERDYSKTYKVCKETCGDDPDILRLEQTWTTDPLTHTDQYLDHGSRVIGNWLAVAPGEEKTVTFRYRQKGVFELPWYQRIGSYRILVQKQSGTTPLVSVMPKAGVGLRIVEFVPQDQITAQPLSSDRVFGVVLERTWP